MSTPPDPGNAGGARRGRGRVRPEPTAAQRALALLVRREHSRKELARKLAARGVEAAEAEAAVARMASEGWQDEGRFAASLARSRALAGYGPLWIRRELETHALPAAAVEAAMAALAEAGADDWLASARALVARRFDADALRDPGMRRRAGDLLARRGFDGEVLRAATRPPVDG